MENKKKKQKGFSLVEVLITIFILSVGLATISAIMAKNIKSAQVAKYQTVASQLAQEGLEKVRNIKDNSATFTTDLPVEGYNYAVDYQSTSLADVFNDGAKRLYLNNAGYYMHISTGNTSTKFFRKLAIVITTDGDGKKTAIVTSFVSWNDSGFPFNNIDGTVGNTYSDALAKCKVGNKCISIVSSMPDLK